MLNAIQTQAAVVAAAKTITHAAQDNVITMTVYALNQTVFAEDGKATPLPKLVKSLRALQARGGAPYSTAARHVAVAMGLRSAMVKKFPDHKRMTQIKEAVTVEDAVNAVRAFAKDMGCTAVEHLQKWIKDDGSPLKAEDRKALLSKPAKKASAGGASEGEGDFLADIKSAYGEGVDIATVEKAIAWLQERHQEMVAAAAAALAAGQSEEAEMSEAA